MSHIVLNVDAATQKISRHVYGQFSEHLGHCIYGGIWVGEDSSIPNLRWPGGCFADDYHWQDGIGPVESRAEMVNAHWGGVRG